MKVLFTTDGSLCSHEAMREARRLMPLHNAEVHVVAVANLLDLVPAYETVSPATMTLSRTLDATRADLEAAVKLLADLGVRATPIERHGEPAAEILALAAELEPDVIVLGSHGRNAVERFFIGSVSDKVAHHFNGPVLIVRPRGE